MANVSRYILIPLFLLGCAKPSDDGGSEPLPPPPRYLYVSSGLCQSGANTTFTATSASNIVYRINASTGQRDITLVDFNPLAESPVGMTDFDNDNLLVAIEKVGSRRIEKIAKRQYGTRSSFSSDVGAFSNVLLGMTRRPDGSVLVSRTNGVALLSSAGATQMKSYLAATGGGAACGTTNLKYASLASTTQGHLIYLNAEANDNKVAVVRAGPTCLAGLTPASTAAFLSTSVWIPGANQLIVATAGATSAVDMNTLLVYEVTEDATTASLSAPVKIYDISLYPGTYPAQLYAISALAYDQPTSSLYVATSNIATSNIPTGGGLYQIEKFTYNPALKTMTRVGSTPFYPPAIDTRCISSMFVGN